MKPQLHLYGDVKPVLRALVRGEPDTAVFIAGGGQTGVNAIGLPANLERFDRHSEPVQRMWTGSSIGSVIALMGSCGLARQSVRMWVDRFGCAEFCGLTLERLIENRVIRLSVLEQAIAELLRNRQPTVRGSLHVAHTCATEGVHGLELCDVNNATQTAQAVIASCAMPTITNGHRQYKGRPICDGDIGDPLPIHPVLALKPKALMIVLSMQWSYFESHVTMPMRDWLLAKMSTTPLSDQVLSKQLSRGYRFFETLSWIDRQLQLPLGHRERLLPPTCIANAWFETNMLQSDGRKLAAAIRASHRGWKQALLSAVP